MVKLRFLATAQLSQDSQRKKECILMAAAKTALRVCITKIRKGTGMFQ